MSTDQTPGEQLAYEKGGLIGAAATRYALADNECVMFVRDGAWQCAREHAHGEIGRSMIGHNADALRELLLTAMEAQE